MNCSKLGSVKFLGKPVSYLNNSGISSTCILYVPKVYLDEYLTAWGNTFPYIVAWNEGEENYGFRYGDRRI